MWRSRSVRLRCSSITRTLLGSLSIATLSVVWRLLEVLQTRLVKDPLKAPWGILISSRWSRCVRPIILCQASHSTAQTGNKRASRSSYRWCMLIRVTPPKAFTTPQMPITEAATLQWTRLDGPWSQSNQAIAPSSSCSQSLLSTGSKTLCRMPSLKPLPRLA